MNVNSVKRYCLSLGGAIEEPSGEPANVLSYKVGGKVFAYFKTSDPERWRFSFRVTPQRFVELTDIPGVKPARYMHRFHWVTVVKVASVETEILQELIDWSYQKALSRLPKKVQKQISLKLDPE